MSFYLAPAAALAERIRINTLAREMRDGRMVWIKRRRWLARPILGAANCFFRLAGNPVRAIDQLAAWQHWEVACFLALHGQDFAAYASGADAVAAEEMPGSCLARHLAAGTLSPPLAAAAGRELRRAHGVDGAAFGGRWSHGDPHSGNFLYDVATDRARLIDFEMMHEPALPAEDRHADDLLVFLQDVVGRIAAQDWLAVAHAFLDAYDRPEIVVRLRPRLRLPGGIPRLWWAVRTSYLPAAELRRRLRELRDSLSFVGV